MSTPNEVTVAARAALWTMSRELFHDEEYANATIDAYRDAVRAEAFGEVAIVLRKQVIVNMRASKLGTATDIGREDCIVRANALGSMANQIADLATKPKEGAGR